FRSNKIQAEHNDRTLSPNYLIPEEFRGQNEVNRPSTQARGLRDKIIENAHQTYLITFKQKSQAKSYQWSLVVNIKNNTTMSDLEKLAEHFEIKYGFQCYQIAIHRDEGYMDENNQPHINHHAHMEFITLKKENGKNMWGQINQVKLRQIQTEIAQILGMERGTDKRVSGTERIEPRKYAQMKNQERKELEAKDKELNTLQQEKTNLESIIQAKDKEIATALDTANTDFKKKIPTLQEAVRRIHGQAEMLSAIYNFLHQTSLNYVSKLAEKYKHEELFTTTFGIAKKLKELYSKIVGKLFGDENAKKDHQDILNAITELQERPTTEQYSQLEQVNSKQAQTIQAKYKEIATLKQERTDLTNKLQKQATETKEAQERVKTLENSKKWLENDLEALESNIKCRSKINQAKDKEIATLKQEKDNLTNQLQKQATETKEAQERIQTLENNEIMLKSDLNAKESTIQAKDKELNTLKQERTDLKDKLQAQEKTINELNKKLQELEDNYRLERERMVAENKHLQEQGLEKIYTQKDYERLKEQHEKEIEVLKKEIQEQDKYKTKSNALRYQQAKQRKAMKIKQTTTPTPSPTPQPTYTYTKRI
uniref:hypothetical protein n=1 Tax=Helicobacter pylori TaxID=210 RepID=UPI001FB960E0